MDERIKALLEPCKTCGDKRRIQNPEYQPPRFLDEGETYTTPAFIECPDCSREALISGLCQQQMENDKLQADIDRMAGQIEEQREEIKKHRWIPVNERLPTLEDACRGQGERGCRDGTVDVIGVDEYGNVFGANYYPKMKVWNFGTEPTHWKPIILPEQALKDKQ